jgi:hypothetical protein
MGHLIGLKRYKDISRIYSMYKITMAPTPQLPFDIISKILQDRKNILQEERQIKETKENFDWMLGEFKSICRLARDDNMSIEDGSSYTRTLIENVEVLERLIYGDDY